MILSKRRGLSLLVLPLVFSLSCAHTTHIETAATETGGTRTVASVGGNLLNFETVVDISAHKGTTFFSLMKDKIKPELDRYAKEGFKVVDGKKTIAALKNVDDGVARDALRAAGGEAKLKDLADDLARGSQKITFYDLPEAISKAGAGQQRYALSTFMSLVSGGGVAVKIDSRNYAYNVNYGTGTTDKDEMTGRSFGESPIRKANDVSDKFYLKSLEDYVRSEGEKTATFYKAILQILTNNDSSGYKDISPEGQAVATDFLAVYMAEQDRHLMSNLKSHHWDAALLEVTLLAAFHSGQSNIMVMFNGNLTESTLKQAPGCDEAEKQPKKASLIDYWQFSSSTDPESCRRSGINVTRKEFRALGQAISAYERKNNAALVQKVERHFKGMKTGGNLFAELSDYLINFKTPSKLTAADLALANDFTAFLMQARKDANKITSEFVK